MNEPIQPYPLLLASTSARRSELLRKAGYRFEVVSPAMEEPDEKHPHVDAASLAESLAYFKARSVAQAHPDQCILAADTIAYLDDEVIGKPADRADARRILKKLSDTTHTVITGVALMHAASERRLLRHDVSVIRVRPLSDAMIETYLDSGAWHGKAGAYGIQDRDDPFVECLEGSFTNVEGLPLELVARMFSEWLA